jgi:hypothetical protein
MVGSATGAVVTMLLNVGNHAPWGGWIVLTSSAFATIISAFRTTSPTPTLIIGFPAKRSLFLIAISFVKMIISASATFSALIVFSHLGSPSGSNCSVNSPFLKHSKSFPGYDNQANGFDMSVVSNKTKLSKFKNEIGKIRGR